MIRYTGNAFYCYADSAAMLLSTIGDYVPSNLIEVLSGVGLGAWKARRFYISMMEPDEGLSKALTILGYRYQEEVQHRDTGAPFKRLREILAKHPALLGPMDMGYLTYLPNREYFMGADHYTLAYEIDDQKIYMHDPLGYPHVFLSLSDAEDAWRAQRVTYGTGYYRLWHSPTRVEEPSHEELYNRAIKHFKQIYLEKPNQLNRVGISGIEAINKHAEDMRAEKLTATDKIIMTHFTLALGAKRALDYAYFFKDHNWELSGLKYEQSKLLGESHTLAAKSDWMKASDVLLEFGEVEYAFQEELLSS